MYPSSTSPPMTHVVVVWERIDGFSWVPYSPQVSQNLERALSKKLTRVNLTDCEGGLEDPEQGFFYVNMRTMKQCSDDLLLPSVNVRRKFYKCESPAGKGLKWEWNDGSVWKTYNMEVQQVIEDAWTKGAEYVDLGKTYLKLPFSINFLNLTQVGENGKVFKPVRRIQQAPYPKLSVKNESVIKNADLLDHRQNILPERPSYLPRKSSPPKRPTKPAKESTPANIARQILNLVTKTSAVKFGHKDEPVQHQPRSRVRTKHSLDTDSSSVKSNRRPSVDTVSTYLSHESRGSRRSARSVQDLLDCSADDDVFAPPVDLPAGIIVGIDQASNYLAKFVRVIDGAEQVSGPCPYCLEELRMNSQYPTVCLVRCNHFMHLNCLNELIIGTQSDKQTNLFIQCPICMAIYGKKIGTQPNGSMTWFKDSTGYIQIVYNFTSGIQNDDHPHPGRKYFAVGFPRKQLLPDTPDGRKVLKYLKIAFDRRLLFSIGCSTTTGVEDIILCNKVDMKSYQEPNYLKRCMHQLVYLGVTD